MQDSRADVIKKVVRERYAEIAAQSGTGCGCGPSDCCSGGQAASAPDSPALSEYSDQEQGTIPAGADMGLGSGNPVSVAAPQPGETVLDLGSGGGVDCFLAARLVGDSGQVIGVDMTPEMVGKARAAAAQGGFANIEFRRGEIENLPVADASIDVVISNCVINLSPDKAAAYGQAFRVLKPGGRLAISDIVALQELPERVRRDLALHAACVAGAATVEDIHGILDDIGFENIRIRPKDGTHEFSGKPGIGDDGGPEIAAAVIEAEKPKHRR